MKDIWGTLFGPKRRSVQNESTRPADTEPATPFPVREQFQTGIPILKANELKALVRDGTSPRERPEFAYPALYLIIKGSAQDKETQMRLLQDVTHIILKNGDDLTQMRSQIRDFVEREIHARNDWAVDAHTLQGRLGKNLTVLESMYQDRAERLLNDSRDVFLVGHATFVGLPYFIRTFQHQKNPKTLYILMPQYISASDADVTSRNEPTGIKIKDGKVSFIAAEDYANLTHAVVVDDIKSTGATERQLHAFLQQSCPHATITFEPIMRGQNTQE